MKRTLIATGLMAASCVYPVAAAEINDKGARTLKESLIHFLPDTVKSTGFLTVKPAGERYEISYDFAKLLKSINKKDFIVSGLKPYSVFAAPLDNGQWKFNSDSDMNFTVKGKRPDGKPTNLSYSVTDMVFSGIFDPAISYFRSGEVTSGPLRMVSKSGPEEVEASVAGMNYSLASAASAAAGGIDFTGKGSFSRFYERIATPETPAIQVRAESLDFDVGVQGVMAEKIRNLVAFMLELVKDEKPSQAEITRLKDLIRGAMPFFTALSEKFSFNQFTVASPIGDFGIHKLDYTFTMSEPAAATRIGFGARIENISTPDGIIPPLYAQLVPDMAEMEVGVADLNFQRFIDTFMEIDFSKPGQLPDAEGERLGKAFLDNGQLTVDFPRVAAKSALYDVEASGKVKGYPDEKDRYTLETSILARDIDKLIQYFQTAAKSDPEFNQVSFAIMMAKGMAKTEPDGRLRWDVKFEDGKSFSVNGQPIQ